MYASIKQLFILESGSNSFRHKDLTNYYKPYLPFIKGQTTDRALVLLDLNLLNSSCERPIYISSSSKQRLIRTITRDTDLLYNYNLMDYSLLLGIDRRKNELVLGIIDYIREFTWDKRMENVVKER